MNLLFTVIYGKFKFQVQDSDLEYFLGGEIWRFEKHIANSEKTTTLPSNPRKLTFISPVYFGWQQNESPLLGNLGTQNIATGIETDKY